MAPDTPAPSRPEAATLSEEGEKAAIWLAQAALGNEGAEHVERAKALLAYIADLERERTRERTSADALEAELKAVGVSSILWCRYCDWNQTTTHTSKQARASEVRAALAVHDTTCPNHPARRLESAEARARALEELIEHTAKALRIGAELARGKDRDGLLALANALTDQLTAIQKQGAPSPAEDFRWLVARLGQLYACGLDPEEGERERFEAIKGRVEGATGG